MISHRDKERMVKEDERHFLDNQFLRYGLALILGLPLLYMLVAGGIHFYRQAKLERSMEQAVAFAEADDMANAVMALQNVFLIDPDHVGAIELMGDLAESQQAPDTLGLRYRLAKLTPDSVSAQVKLARAAMREGMLDEAEEALGKVPPGSRLSIPYQNLRSAIALKQGRLEEAEEAARTAITLDPGNPHLELNLAIVLLEKDSPASGKELNAALDFLQRTPETRGQLRRAMLAYASRKGQWDEAVKIAESIVSESDATITDHLQFLDLLEKSDPPRFDIERNVLLESAPATAREAVAVASWLNRKGRHGEAESLLAKLPEDWRESVAVRIAMADTLSAKGNWQALEEFLGDDPWAMSEFVRQAYLAKAIRNQTLGNDWQPHWRMALRSGAEEPGALIHLYQVVHSWQGWEPETERLLWKIHESGLSTDWALESLHSLYQERGESAGLFRVNTILYDQSPDDPLVKNNYAQLSLLRKTRVREAYLLARQNHQEFPENPAFASTYAFALSRNGQCEKAVEVMRSIPPHALQRPDIAAYCGIILADCGKPAEAAPYLAIASSANLLDVEKRLLRVAQSKIAEDT